MKNHFLISEAEKKRILNLHNSYKHNHGTSLISEQVVTDYDSVWDYKKEGDNYFTKKKTSDSWIKLSGNPLNDVKSKVFGDSSTQSTRTVTNKDVSSNTTTTTSTLTKSPFTTKKHGIEYREWLNTTYPNIAKKYDVDSSSKLSEKFKNTEAFYTNKNILNSLNQMLAWNSGTKKGQKISVWEYYQFKNPDWNEKTYKEKIETGDFSKDKDEVKDSNDEGALIKFLRKYFPSIVQLIYSKNLTNSDFDEGHIDIIKDVVKNAKKRIPNFQYNKFYGTEYKDYDSKTASILDKRGQSIWELIQLYLHDSDMFDISTTLGRFSFKVDKNGNINIYDKYDFTRQYNITKEDLDWDNTNTFQKITKIMELGGDEVGLYGAVRHLGHLHNPQGGTNQGLTVNLNLQDPELTQFA